MQKVSKSQTRRVSVQKKELLDLDSKIIASAVFVFKELKLKDDQAWYLKLLLKTQLPQSFKEYQVKFSLNEEPFENRIADLKRKQDDVKADKQEDLFPTEGAKKTQIKNIADEIKEVEQELEELRAQTPEIEFDASIEELKYIDGDTRVVLMIDSTIVSKINEVKGLLDRHYKVELIRE